MANQNLEELLRNSQKHSELSFKLGQATDELDAQNSAENKARGDYEGATAKTAAMQLKVDTLKTGLKAIAAVITSAPSVEGAATVLEALQTLMAGVFFYGEELYHYAHAGAGLNSSARVEGQPAQVYKKDGKFRTQLTVNGLQCHSPSVDCPKACAARARVEIPDARRGVARHRPSWTRCSSSAPSRPASRARRA